MGAGGLRRMRDGWFYNENGKPSGPRSIDALITFVRKQRDPHNVLVWNTGHEEWRLAKDVPQIAELIFKPPPIPPPIPNPPTIPPPIPIESHDVDPRAAALPAPIKARFQQKADDQIWSSIQLDQSRRNRTGSIRNRCRIRPASRIRQRCQLTFMKQSSRPSHGPT